MHGRGAGWLRRRPGLRGAPRPESSVRGGGVTVSPCAQPKGKKAKGKKVAPAPAVVKKQEAKKVVNPLFEKRPKNFGIGEWKTGGVDRLFKRRSPRKAAC